MQIKAVIIGAGNVGTHLAIALKNEGVQILQIVSKTMKSAVELASRMECSFTTDLQDINLQADIYIVCVTDNAIIPVLRQLQIGNKFIVHTSGSMGIDVFYDLAQNYGVVYPMQTFSKFKDINYAEIPIFIEANSPENQQMLFNFVKKISPHVQVINSQQRCMLHICAVFANNFTNHMCTIAEMLMKEHQLKFETFKPLLRETFEKITKYSPSISQTGPAMRNDLHVVQKHIDLLAQFPSIQEIYTHISNNIIEMHKKEE
ncbi:MAG: glutamyl-tRNA reductase [Bacteroidetes bacterium ADurb.Bin217]|nr:MAG: glutamyl-tRNA reductase [Bacteroidetes bacterium ADurb.Bin217]